MTRIITVSLIFMLTGIAAQTADTSHFSLCKESTKKLDYCQVYTVTETMPEVPGGMAALQKYIAANLNLSLKEAEHFVGSIYITFIVDDKGWVKNPCIINRNSKDQGLYKIEIEALRVVKSMPQWKPAVHKGQNVCCFMTLPIRF